MKETFIKKYWDEEDVLYYLHFKDNDAVRQIEISGDTKVFLNVDVPAQALLLYDQDLNDLEFNKEDFITKDVFTKAWEDR